MKQDIIVRKARPEDREAILALSAKVWEGDYLGRVVDKWMAEESGEFSVALIDDRVAGFSKFTELVPGHGWLQGARVDSALQNKGVGRALTGRHIDLARSKGLKTLRMATDSNNIASRTLAEKLGFFLAADYTRYRCAPLPAEQADAVPAVPLFDGLPPAPANGIVSAGWTFYPWDEKMMRDWARAGRLYGSKEAGMAMMQGNRPERVNVLMLWGEPDAVKDCLVFARRQPREVEIVNCIITDTKYRQVLLAAGYDNTDVHTVVVYQYNL